MKYFFRIRDVLFFWDKKKKKITNASVFKPMLNLPLKYLPALKHLTRTLKSIKSQFYLKI